MVTFVFVICILMTIGCVVNLSQGFKEQVVSSSARQIQFCISTGLVIWGWFLYF